MLKYFSNLALGSKFVKVLRETEAVENVYFKNCRINRANRFNRSKFEPQMERNFLTSAFQSKKFFTNNKPIVLLSGILTFLGIQEKTPEEKESDLIMAIKRGILLVQREQYDKAEKVLHHALKLAQDQNDAEGITYVYDVLANLAFERGQHEKAEKLFVSVLQRLIANGEDQESNKVVNISLKLAKIFEDTKQHKKAEQGYKFCIETLDKKLEENDEDTLALWGMSMDWYARYLLGLQKNTEALSCFKKAYEMCVKVNGMEHEQTVVLLNDMGTVSSLIGDTDSALSYLEEARKIGKNLPEMKDLAAIYINLGQLYLLREMYKESRNACEEGLNKARSHQDDTAIHEANLCLEKINRLLKGSGEKNEIHVPQKVLVN